VNSIRDYPQRLFQMLDFSKLSRRRSSAEREADDPLRLSQDIATDLKRRYESWRRGISIRQPRAVPAAHIRR
jgi:hypothetical protein